MEIDVYKKYDFSYNEKQFMKSFKEALAEKGYNSLTSFYGLVKKFDYYSYETIKSYYNLRRVVPLQLFASICKYLNLDATKLMCPNSIYEYNYKQPIAADSVSRRNTFFCFNSVFYDKESIELLMEDNGYEKFNDFTKKEVYTLSLILSKYNYLLQKYYYASLSNSELNDLVMFSFNHIMERKTNSSFDFKEFVKWKKELKTTDFLDEFYKKYILSYNGCICRELLKENKSYFTKELFDMINNLLYDLDKVQ